MRDEVLAEFVYVGCDVSAINKCLSCFDRLSKFVPEDVLFKDIHHSFTSLHFKNLPLFRLKLNDGSLEASPKLLSIAHLSFAILKLVPALDGEASICLLLENWWSHQEAVSTLEDCGCLVTFFCGFLHAFLDYCASFRHHEDLGGTECIVLLAAALHRFNHNVAC